MDSKSKADSAFSQEAFTNKQIHINQLRGQLDSTKEAVESKETDVKVNTEQLAELKTQLKTLIDKCEDIYTIYDTQRQQVEELKNNKRNDSLSSAWDTAPVQDAWASEPTPALTATTSSTTSNQDVYSRSGYVKYRALYEFEARNNDEITFMPGDTVMVPLEQNAEPGWMAGEINGHTGWFPETYVEKIEEDSTSAYASYEPTPVPETVTP